MIAWIRRLRGYLRPKRVEEEFGMLRNNTFRKPQETDQAPLNTPSFVYMCALIYING